MSRRHIAWMEHPLGAPTPEGIEINLKRAERWLKWLLFTFPNVDFAADWILWCRALDDLTPEHRKRGLAFDDEMISRSDSAWYVGGRITDGMKRGMSVARSTNIYVVDLTPLGDEPPTEFNRELAMKLGELLAEAGYRHQHADDERKTIHLFASQRDYDRAVAAGL